MTKEEAQIILDSIDETTVVDDNWLGYLVEDKECKVLRAISIITGLSWNDFLEKHEGDYISDFQTKPELYLGRTIKVNEQYHLIIRQSKMYIYYVTGYNFTEDILIKDLDRHLI